MRLYNCFEQYFLFAFIFLLITYAFGHKENNVNLIDSEPIVIETANIDSVNVENHSTLPLSDKFQSRQEYINKLNELIKDTDDIENDLHNQFPPLSLQNETQAGDQVLLVNNSLQNDDGNNSIASKTDMKTCWCLSKTFQSIFEIIENQTLSFINLLPEFIQTSLFRHVDDHRILINIIWFGSISTILCLFSSVFLVMIIKRLKLNKCEKQIRNQCQQLQQHNDQIEFENATFQRKNQKLLDEINELKDASNSYEDEILHLRKEYIQLQKDLKTKNIECSIFQEDIDHKQDLIQKYEFDMQKQMETVAHMNNEILQYQQELEKERETIAKLQSNDLSLERFEKLQELIHEFKSEITQLTQDKFVQTDQLQQVQQQANQLDIDNNELTIKMKQLKDLLEQRDQTIARIREKMLDDNDEEKITEISDLLSTATQNNSSDGQQKRELLSTIDNDVEKANQRMHDLHSGIEEKTRRIKELNTLVNQEKDRCRELETKLKVVLELRERDAHLHIRQLGQTDSELRKARTDTERVRILQQQLELKQQQLEDVQKVLTNEQTKFSEECSKLQHETHEKWMEVKRLTRELDGAKKECEGLRRQITKYSTSDRSSQEKRLNNTGRVSSEPETNGSSPPPPLPYQQEEKSIDQSINSSTTSPVNISRTKPPVFVFPRPCFRPTPLMFAPVPNRFMLSPRFPMPFNGSQGMINKDNFLSINKNQA